MLVCVVNQDPSDCVKALFDFVGQSPSDRNAQQDVTEFNALILDAIETAMEASYPSKPKKPKQLQTEEGDVKSEPPVATTAVDGGVASSVLDASSSSSSASSSSSPLSSQLSSASVDDQPLSGAQWMAREFQCALESDLSAREQDGRAVSQVIREMAGQVRFETSTNMRFSNSILAFGWVLDFFVLSF